MNIPHTGDMKTDRVPSVGHGYEVVCKAEEIHYNSIGAIVTGGGYRTYEWVDPEKDLAAFS
jgi:hypothetical protein